MAEKGTIAGFGGGLRTLQHSFLTQILLHQEKYMK
jgi:hypothetical protein